MRIKLTERVLRPNCVQVLCCVGFYTMYTFSRVFAVELWATKPLNSAVIVLVKESLNLSFCSLTKSEATYMGDISVVFLFPVCVI